MNSNKIKYGMIGVGPRGRALMHAALASGEVEIAGVADVDSQAVQLALQMAPGAKSFVDYRDLLSWGEYDAILIATPNYTHEAIVSHCLETDFHILCEKPLAVTMEGIDLIISRASKRSAIFQVGLELRHHRMLTELKRQLDNRELGDVRMLWCKEFRPPFKPGFEQWRTQADRSGGSLLEKNSHHFDVFNWLVDSKPVKVSAFGGNDVVYKDENVLDNAWVLVEYANGVRANLGLSLFQKEHYLEIGLLGSEGSAVCYSPNERLEWKGKSGEHHIDYGPLADTGFEHGGEVEQHLAFVDSIRSGTPPIASLDSIRDSHLICLAADASIRSGQTIDLHNWNPIAK